MDAEPYRAAADAPLDVEVELLVAQRELSRRIVRISVSVAVLALLVSTTVLYTYFAEQLLQRRGAVWPKGVGIAAMTCSAAWIAALVALARRFVFPGYRKRVLARWCEERGVDPHGLDHLLF